MKTVTTPAAGAPASQERLPPIVRSLGAVSFFNDLASEMIYPLIPALITRTLGGGAVSLGLFDGISEATASLAKLWAGWLADRPRWRRPLVIGGYLVAALTRPVIGATSAAWQVIALRAGDRLGKGIRTPPRDAVIADATPPALQGRAFGFHRAMDHAGAVLGPLVAWALLAGLHLGPDTVILWSVAPGAVAVATVLWAMRGPAEGAAVPEPQPAALRVPQPPPAAGTGSARDRVFVLVVLFALVRFPETLLLLQLQDLGLSVALVPAVWAVLHLIRSVGSYPGGRLADAIGSRWVMLAGWVLYGTVAAGLAVAPTAGAGVAWFLAFGAVAALTESPERAFVARAAGPRKTGTGFGLYHASVGLAGLLGGLAFGTAYARLGAGVALGLSAGAAGLLAGALLLGRFEGQRAE